MPLPPPLPSLPPLPLPPLPLPLPLCRHGMTDREMALDAQISLDAGGEVEVPWVGSGGLGVVLR